MTASENTNNNPDEQQQQQQQPQQQKGQNKPDSSFATDKDGNVNVSRGIIGVASNSTNASSVTEGTVADRVNQPSRTITSVGGGQQRVNPVTAEDLDRRIQLERAKAGFDRGAQEQVAIKARTEAQGFKYTPPEEYKDHPGLAATEDNLQQEGGEPAANQAQGEQVIDVDNTDDQQKRSTDNLKG